MNKMTKNTTVQVTEHMMNMSAETLQTCVHRRAARSIKNTRLRHAVVVMGICLALMFTAAFAVTSQQSETPTSTEATTVVVETIVTSPLGVWDISAEEKAHVVRIVMATARGESPLAMQAVAQCIRTLCEDENISVLDCMVEYHWSGNYAGLEDFSDAETAVNAVIAGYPAVATDIRYTYNPAEQSGNWHESQQFVLQIGALRFFTNN